MYSVLRLKSYKLTTYVTNFNCLSYNYKYFSLVPHLDFYLSFGYYATVTSLVVQEAVCYDASSLQ